ncbi:hypothetical protein BRE01_67550 [Brevibacillus reuszeri]|uniref:AAA domain-containing protein n=1 Tax=Brevibacillus reuszeri TaxID=54915 RepID=A0A0K9YN83_9BACL|nr:hypothetical protein [Brevibacillus reuszeri]KNB70203.1 hypothetical protein ADS79_14635 [Brevibacillus reuszeri]GED73053.1 hypothetical protein BRE01_67550 [Brevibacillus reuszeri]
MAKAKSGSVVKKGLKFFLYGEQGTWKSSFALAMAKMKSELGKPLRVLYIDCETGSVDNYLEDLESEGVDLNNILLVYTTSYTEVEEWATKAMDNEDLYIEDEDGNEVVALDAEGNPFRADVIIVDGITVISDNVKFAAIGVSEKRARLKAKAQEKNATEQAVAEATAGLEFKDHDKIKMKGKNLLRSLITGTDKYVVVTSREKTKKVMQKVGDKMELVEVGKVPDTWDGAEYEFFTVLRNFEDEDGTIKSQIMRKDRTRVFEQNEIIDNPTPLYWQSVIDGNRGKQSNVVKESLESSVEKDEDVIAKGFSKVEESSAKQEEEKQPETVAEYREAIDKQIKTLSDPKKKALLPKVKKAGLTVDFNKIDDTEQMKKFYELVTE